MEKIDWIELRQLAVPLSRPYYWSKGVITECAPVLAIASINGRVGAGEGTTVPGYSWETTDTVWEALSLWAASAVGTTPDHAREMLDSMVLKSPFAVTAAEHALAGATDRGPQTGGAVPLIGTVNVAPNEDVCATVEGLVGRGHVTLKVKVGLDPREDARRVIDVVRCAGSGVRIRVDANQAYSLADAKTFASKVEDPQIEAFEQPLPAESLDLMAELRAFTSLPLMLDESVWTDEDIRTASDYCDLVKLRMMKSGGPRHLRRQILLARSLGLDVVVGNGVVTGLGALEEARVHLQVGLNSAGEMNGFLKLKHEVLRESLQVCDGSIVVSPTTSPELDWPRVEELTERSTRLESRS